VGEALFAGLAGGFAVAGTAAGRCIGVDSVAAAVAVAGSGGFRCCCCAADG